MRLTEYLQHIYGLLEDRTAYTAYYPTIVVKLTNHDFPCLVRKIAIGLLSISALVTLKPDLWLVYGLLKGRTVHFADRKQDLQLA